MADRTIDNPEESPDAPPQQPSIPPFPTKLETLESTRGEDTTVSTDDMGVNPRRRPSPPHRAPPRVVQSLVRHSRYLHKLRDTEKKQKAVQADTTRLPSQLKRSRLFKKFLRQAEPMGFRKTIDVTQDRHNVQVHTAYDTKSWNVKTPDIWQAGPLKLAFSFYAKLLDPKIATGSYYPTFEAIERAANTCTFTEVLAFAWDFDIVPRFLSRGDLRYAFAYVKRATDDYINELTYEQFEEFLSRVALIAIEDSPPGQVIDYKESVVMDSEGKPIFIRKTGGALAPEGLPKPEFKKRTSWQSAVEEAALEKKVEPITPMGKVKKFLREVGLNSLEYVKDVINSKGKTTAGRLNGTIKLNSPRDGDEQSQMNRLLRKRDGAMCDYSAPKLMAKRNRCRQDFSPELVKPWYKLREFQSNENVWKGFHAPVLYIGRVVLGKPHRYRILVRNPMRDAITIECEPRGVPFLTLQYVRAPIPAGLTVNISCDCVIREPGELAGFIKIKWRVYKTEVSARKRPGRAAPDMDMGSVSVPVFAVGVPNDSFASASAEMNCPAAELAKATTEPCPRYYLPPDHVVHKYEKPATNGEWQRAQLKYISGRATRDQPAHILPRPGTGTMSRLKEYMDQPTIRQDTTVSEQEGRRSKD
jgi:hypothetical protein